MHSPFPPSLCLSQALPCPCGSMSIGYLVALVTKMPFWILSSSVGKPCVSITVMQNAKYLCLTHEALLQSETQNELGLCMLAAGTQYYVNR